MNAKTGEVTQLLNAWCHGDAEAFERLAPLLEAELRHLARIYLGREATGHTLQPTALVHEAYIRLINWDVEQWQNRAHFYAVAAKMMRRILVNQAISRGRAERGRAALTISLASAGGPPSHVSDVVALHEALLSLARMDERRSRLVELRYFGGLTTEETAEVLGISPRTVHREWDLARAWLFRELRRPE
jgi:RNA polymerase sigma factor (TIGR02999 family)